jgi:hypothetical protein
MKTLKTWDHVANKTLRGLLVAYVAANPRTRIQGNIKFTRNTGCSKQRGCVLCGVSGPSWCARYPVTRRAEAWEREHRCWDDPTRFERILNDNNEVVT